MKAKFSLSTILFTILSYTISIHINCAQAAQYDPGPGRTLLMIGQNYSDEYIQYSHATQIPPAGGSTYGDIYSGTLNLASQQLLTILSNSQPQAFVEIGFSWKDAMTDNGYPWYRTVAVEEDIVNGKFDAKLDAIAQYIQSYPNFRFLMRIDYEVSDNFHCNTNPEKWDPLTQNCDYYKNAYNYIAHRIRDTLNTKNVDFVYHPVRGQADKLYPGSEYVDWIGFSVFNHDVCLDTIESNGIKVNCTNARIDSNLDQDLQKATQVYQKPVIIAESAYQDSTQPFELYLNHLFWIIQQYDVHALVYIHSNWPEHAWTLPWTDSRVTISPNIFQQWMTETSGNRYITG